MEKGFKFDIPRILTLSDCAFRILFTKYDHFSAKSKSFYPRKKKKEGRNSQLLGSLTSQSFIEFLCVGHFLRDYIS